MRITIPLFLSIATCVAAPPAFASVNSDAPFYEQDVSPTAEIVVTCRRLPYISFTPEERARELKMDPDTPPRAPERYQYSFVLRERGGTDKVRTLCAYIVYDWSAMFHLPPNFSIVAVSVEAHAVVFVYHEDGSTCANVIPLDGTRAGVGMTWGETTLVLERASSDPRIDSAKILGSYETGDLAVVLHNSCPGSTPEFYKFSLHPQWVREPDALPPATQPAASRP